MSINAYGLTPTWDVLTAVKDLLEAAVEPLVDELRAATGDIGIPYITTVGLRDDYAKDTHEYPKIFISHAGADDQRYQGEGLEETIGLEFNIFSDYADTDKGYKYETYYTDMVKRFCLGYTVYVLGYDGNPYGIELGSYGFVDTHDTLGIEPIRVEPLFHGDMQRKFVRVTAAIQITNNFCGG